ncbi:MAG: hypothetical protein ACO1QR_07490 [Chthoniobacteraceae bacterium]
MSCPSVFWRLLAVCILSLCTAPAARLPLKNAQASFAEKPETLSHVVDGNDTGRAGWSVFPRIDVPLARGGSARTGAPPAHARLPGGAAECGQHSGAETVVLTIRYEAPDLLVKLEDDGRGLPADTNGMGKDGLNNMRSRLEMIGGTFAIRNLPEGGTQVTMRAPLLKSAPH